MAMASTKFSGYHKRLFGPTVISLWILVIIIGVFHYTRSENIRRNTLRTSIDVITSRVVNLYESRDDERAPHYIRFIDNYFRKTEYYNLCLSVFNVSTGKVVCSMGFPLNPPEGVHKDTEVKTEPFYIEGVTPEEAFYYRVKFTSDNRIAVVALLPQDSNYMQSFISSMWFFTFLFLLGVLMSLFAYWFTGYLAQNIQNMKYFVDCALKDEDFDENTEFPDDELGEISQNIVSLYKDRQNLIEQMKKEHAEAIRAAEERAKRRKQLTSNLNHELKTPLGIIKGYVETLIKTPEIDSDKRADFLYKTHSQVIRLQEILEDISTISRLEEPELKEPMESVDFYALALDLADEIVEARLNEGKKLIIDLPDECYVVGNEKLLSAALLNLTKNAVVYSLGTEIGLTLSKQEGDEYFFTFYDNGCGVPDEHLPYLFDRFYRVDSGRSRKVGGTGLGLSIVKRTIIYCGGKIFAQKHEGGGLEICFSLKKAEA